MSTTWTVPARVVAVVDGDTLKLDLDLGWHIRLTGVNARIYGIDAPEIATPEGKAAKAYAIALLGVFESVVFVSHSLDKYGRPLGTVTMTDGRDFGLAMLEAGHAVPYFGGARTEATPS